VEVPQKKSLSVFVVAVLSRYSMSSFGFPILQQQIPAGSVPVRGCKSLKGSRESHGPFDNSPQ